jgi:hypothetical protein
MEATMGCLYRPSHGRGKRKSSVWWIKYKDTAGHWRAESSGDSDKEKARDLLKLREADVVKGVPVTPQVSRYTLGEAVTDLLAFQRMKGLRSVDETARRLRLHVLPYFGERRKMSSLTATDVLRYAERVKRQGHNVPWVFFRMVAKGRGGDLEPRRIVSFTKAWRSACRAAGLPGRIPHDLRRSAIRTFVCAGLSEHTAMALSGHKAASVFKRYDIISEGDLDDAAAKLAEAASAPFVHPGAKRRGRRGPTGRVS